MKIKPEIYAKTLIDLMEKGEQNIASKFWRQLQKNKQYRDLNKILEALVEEYAKKNSQTLIKVYSAQTLDERMIEQIKNKVNDSSNAIVKNIIKPGITGIIMQVGDKVFDLSIENKINKLNKVLMADNR